MPKRPSAGAPRGLREATPSVPPRSLHRLQLALLRTGTVRASREALGLHREAPVRPTDQIGSWKLVAAPRGLHGGRATGRWPSQGQKSVAVPPPYPAAAAPSRRPPKPLVVNIAPTPLDSPRVRTTPFHAARQASVVPVAARIAQTLQVVGFGDRRQSRDAPQPARRVRKICGPATAGGIGRGGPHPGGPVGAAVNWGMLRAPG